MNSHEAQLVDKLHKLTNTQQSIQAVSLWLSFNKKYKESVKVWTKEILSVASSRKLLYLYLANDVMQTTRKKTQEFIQEFGNVLSDVVSEVVKDMPQKDRESLLRMVNVWDERKLFSSAYVQSLRSCITQYINSNASSTVSTVSGTGSPTPFASSTLQVNPVAKALVELEQAENMKPSLTFMNQEYERAASNLLSAESISSTNITELQNIRNTYENYIKQFSDFYSKCNREYEKRAKYIEELEKEIQVQNTKLKESASTLQNWTSNINTIQNFLTNVEISINQSKNQALYNAIEEYNPDEVIVPKKRSYEEMNMLHLSTVEPDTKKSKLDINNLLQAINAANNAVSSNNPNTTTSAATQFLEQTLFDNSHHVGYNDTGLDLLSGTSEDQSEEYLQ